MELFSHKKILLSEIIDGLRTTLNEAQEMQRLRQAELIENLADAESGEPVAKQLKIGN